MNSNKYSVLIEYCMPFFAAMCAQGKGNWNIECRECVERESKVVRVES